MFMGLKRNRRATALRQRRLLLITEWFPRPWGAHPHARFPRSSEHHFLPFVEGVRGPDGASELSESCVTSTPPWAGRPVLPSHALLQDGPRPEKGAVSRVVGRPRRALAHGRPAAASHPGRLL